jgi:hypothetical protein
VGVRVDHAESLRDLVLSSPDRPRDDRRLLALALLLSLLVHILGGGLATRFAHQLALVVARLVPAPQRTPEEMAATSDIVTIEKRTVPREVHHQPNPSAPRPVHPAPRPLAHPRTQSAPQPLAEAPARPIVVPTAAPRPIRRPPHATVNPGKTERKHTQPRPRVVAEAPVPATAPNALSAKQIAALDEQFSRTIAQAQRSLTDVPHQRKPPSTMKRYQMVMTGTLDDIRSAQGECRAIETKHDGPYVWHIMDCDFLYTDGYHEHVTIPWWQRYPENDDPELHPRKMYVVQPPPEGAPAPQPLNFSRLVCTFYKPQCQALIERENAAGGRPAAP